MMRHLLFVMTSIALVFSNLVKADVEQSSGKLHASLAQSLPITTDLSPTADSAIGKCVFSAVNYLEQKKLIQKENDAIIPLLNSDAYRQAFRLLIKASSNPINPWAAYALGNLYQAGLGVNVDPEQSFHWYLRAANEGDVFARRKVANDYLNGYGVAVNPQRAAYWFRKGVMVNQVALAYIGLSNSNIHGRFMPKNLEKAHWYYQRGLVLLHTLYKDKVGAAAYALGIGELHGIGVPKNPIKAKQYFCKALAWHDPLAASALVHLQKESYS